MKQLTLLLTLAICVVCCTNTEHQKALDKIQTAIQNEDSAALLLLRKLGADKENLSRAERMRYELMSASAQNTFFIPMKGDSVMKEVVDYYSDHGTDHDRMVAWYLLGCVYRDKKDVPRALTCYQQATRRVDTAHTDCDYRQLCRICSQTALLFQNQRSPQLELAAWKRAIRYAWAAKDTLAALDYLHSSGGVYYALNKPDDAVRNTWYVYCQYQEMGRTELAADILIPIIDDELRKGRLREAKSHIDEYRQKSNAFDQQGEVKPDCECFYIYLARYYEAVARLDSALLYYRKLLQYPSVITDMEVGYGGLMSVYHQMNMPDSVVKYAKLYTDANDTASFQQSAEVVTRMQSLYNYDESRKQAAAKTNENRMLRRLVFMLVFVAVMVAGVVWISLRRQRRKRICQLIVDNKKYFDMIFRYNQLTAEMEHLKSDAISYQERKEKEILQLQHRLSAYQVDNTKLDQLNVEQMLLSHPIVQKLHGLATHAMSSNEKEWNILNKTVSASLPVFFHRIYRLDYGLSEVELRVCVLIRLGFIPSEVSVLLKVTKQRMTNIRTSINKKLFQGSGTKQIDVRIRKL